MNSLEPRPSWFRVCWTLSSEGRVREHGTLTGRDVPSMLASMRDCLPLALQDPHAIRTAASTPEGWSYASDTMTVHTHRAPAQGAWLPYFGCHECQGGADS